MIIKMLYSKKGSPDGHIVRQYHKGETYDVPQSLAASFLNAGAAFNAEPDNMSDDEIFNCFRSGNPERQLEALNSLTMQQIAKG